MAVDPFVTASRDSRPRPKLEMPPAKPWVANRPGDIVVGQPEGGAFGYQGPDQGYALRLADFYRDAVTLAPSEEWDDVMRGCVAVALRRASIFGRAPVRDDIEVALLAWGFLPDGIPAELVDRLVRSRRPLFAAVQHD